MGEGLNHRHPNNGKRFTDTTKRLRPDQSLQSLPARITTSKSQSPSCHKQTIVRSSIATVPADLIEAETLNLLGIEVIDLQDYTDYVIPHGDDRYQIWLGNEFSGLVWTWVNQFITPFRAYNTLTGSRSKE
ncbi:hypothetical protein [Chamaesiphon sp.]|uniref:hypothetical protein n=1 Tax=Chamaesiphon sp. TaxID=2814140 RepID=UPI003593AD6F